MTFTIQNQQQKQYYMNNRYDTELQSVQINPKIEAMILINHPVGPANTMKLNTGNIQSMRTHHQLDRFEDDETICLQR